MRVHNISQRWGTDAWTSDEEGLRYISVALGLPADEGTEEVEPAKAGLKGSRDRRSLLLSLIRDGKRGRLRTYTVTHTKQTSQSEYSKLNGHRCICVSLLAVGILTRTALALWFLPVHHLEREEKQIRKWRPAAIRGGDDSKYTFSASQKIQKSNTHKHKARAIPRWLLTHTIGRVSGQEVFTS